MLEELLQVLQLAPPYILIAHSIGGIFANLFARIQPHTVGGMVLIEAAHPEEPRRQAAFQPPRVIRFLTGALRTIETYFDPYKYSEDESIAETVQQLRAAGPFPPVPLAVVTGGKKMPLVPEESFQVHQQCQQELATLSPQAVHIVAKQSGHFPQVTEPDIVIRAVQEVLATAQAVPSAGG
jgi:pimeloyl-ACP methyl ester carboxylesterase